MSQPAPCLSSNDPPSVLLEHRMLLWYMKLRLSERHSMKHDGPSGPHLFVISPIEASDAIIFTSGKVDSFKGFGAQYLKL